MMRSLILALCGAALVVAPSQAADWGNVKGQIVFDGAPPAAKQLDVNKDQAHCLAKGAINSETWVINPATKGVKNVFVWLVSESGGKPAIHSDYKDPPKEPAKMDQPNCAFVPHCQGIREGQMLLVHNSAPIAHNV